MENESKKILLDPVSLNNNIQIMTENDEHFVFDDEELIVYSPEGSFEEFIDENVHDESEQDAVSTFLQCENCFLTSTQLPQCRECTKDNDCDKYSCRFYEFRKIEKNSNGDCKVVGFLDPHIDPSFSGKSSLTYFIY